MPAAHPTYPAVLAVASINQVVGNLTTWITAFLVSLATLYLTIGGARYLMAGGDPAEVEKAKVALRSAMIGYALAVLAPDIVSVLRSLTGS